MQTLHEISPTHGVCILLNKVVGNSPSNNWMSLNDESESMWEEAVVAYIKSLTTLLFGRTEKP